MPRRKKEHRAAGLVRATAVTLGLFVLGVAGVLSLSLIWQPLRVQPSKHMRMMARVPHIIDAKGNLKHKGGMSVQLGRGTVSISGGFQMNTPDDGERAILFPHAAIRSGFSPTRPWAVVWQMFEPEPQNEAMPLLLTDSERQKIAQQAFDMYQKQGFNGFQVRLPPWLARIVMSRVSHRSMITGPAVRTWVWIQPGQWFKQNWMWHGAALLAGLGLSALAWYNPWVIRRRRIARGACVGCGYDLRDTPADQPCPECGKEAVVLSA